MTPMAPEFMRSKYFHDEEVPRLDADAPRKYKSDFELYYNDDGSFELWVVKNPDMKFPFLKWDGTFEDHDDRDFYNYYEDPEDEELSEPEEEKKADVPDFMESKYFKTEPNWHMEKEAPIELKRSFEKYVNNAGGYALLKMEHPEIKEPCMLWDGSVVDMSKMEK